MPTRLLLLTLQPHALPVMITSTADSPPAPPDAVELTYEDALRLAVRMHRDGRVDGAEVLYRRLLELEPDDPNALHYLGMLLGQRGRRQDRAEALQRLRDSIRIDPSVAAWHNNLGNVLLDGSEVDAAASAYARCSELDPGNVEVLNNLGCLLRGLGRTAEAEAVLRRALDARPDFADAHSNYALLLAATRRLPEALTHFVHSLELRPRNARTRRLLGLVYTQNGRLDEAAEVFREWAADEPDSVQARHHLAAVTGQDVPERASDDYVVDVFDSFASSFDAKLEVLEYQAPRLVGEALAPRLGGAGRTLEVLDAGCGTGLCAPWLVAYARRLTGVDLSTGMLELARARGGYDELVAAELTGWLAAHPGTYDLVVSADTLCYFGVLDAAIGAARRALRPDGWLVFTVEALLGADDGIDARVESESGSDFDDAAGRPQDAPARSDYRLQPHGRYSHRRAYVERLLRGAGFEAIDVSAVVLRKENSRPVDGWLVVARAPA